MRDDTLRARYFATDWYGHGLTVVHHPDRPVVGYAAFELADGDDPTFVGFCVDREDAERLVSEHGDVAEAVLLDSGLYAANDVTLDGHDALLGRVQAALRSGRTAEDAPPKCCGAQMAVTNPLRAECRACGKVMVGVKA